MSEEKDYSDHLSLKVMKDYLSGSITGKGANQIERHLQECSLCSDAMMGLEKMDPKILAEDVDQLKSAVVAKSRIRSKISWTFRIAAGIILLGLTSILIIDYLRTSNERTLSTLESAAPEEDSISTPGEGALAINDTLSGGEPASPDQSPAIASSEALKEISETEKQNEASPGAGPAMIPAEDKAIALAKTEDEVGQRIQEETIVEPLKLQSETKPAEAVETQPAEIAKEEISLREEAAPEKKSARAARSLAQQPVQTADQLEAVSGMDTNTETELFILPKSEPEPFDKNAEPEIGFTEYSSQILGKLVYPEAAANAGISGFVILTFEVDSSGLLSGFKIQSGLGYGCDEEAVRVIKNGPAWTPAVRKGAPAIQTIEMKVPFTGIRR